MQKPSHRILQLVNSAYAPGIVLFILFLSIGLSIYKDYGIGWDEGMQRDIGILNYNYVRHDNGALKQSSDRYYGAGYELPLIYLERKLHFNDSRDVYLMRHLITHIFFLLSAFCGYLLFYRLFKDRLLASIGFLFLVLDPRIYAHSFFNSKDVPTLSMFIICFTLAEIAFRKNRAVWFALLGSSCGFLTGIRIIGILLLACILLFLFIDSLHALKQGRKIKNHIKHACLFAITFIAALYISYPNLWTKPLENFVEACQSFSHFVWHGKVLFNGQTYLGTQLPYSYLPVWFAITTPPVYLLAGMVGLLLIIISVVRQPAAYLFDPHQRNFLMYAIIFIAPIALVIITHATLYDDWRHLYFVYPAFVLLALFAIKKISNRNARWVAIAACSAQIFSSCFFMIKYHPFQEVYFNAFVSHNTESLRANYDMDYWGCSFKQGMEYILAHDPSPTVKITGNETVIDNNMNILTAEERKRLQFERTESDADYFITNFRYHPRDYPYTNIYYQVQVQNSTILRVYKLK